MLLGAKRLSSLKHRLRGAGVSEQLIGDNRSPTVLNQTKQSFGLDFGLRECELWIKEQTPEMDEGHWPGMEASKGQIPTLQWRSLESQWAVNFVVRNMSTGRTARHG